MIEDYCLGILPPDKAAEVEVLCSQHPALQKELLSVQASLLNLTESFQKSPPPAALNGILQEIDNDLLLDRALQAKPGQNLKAFIPISPHSDREKWQSLLAHLYPPADFSVHAHKLYDDGARSLLLVWVKDVIPEEIHEEMLESVLCLEGHCEGILVDQSVRLNPGDYWDVPLYESHSLRVTSQQPAKLIIMRSKVA